MLGPGGWSRPIGVRALVETSEMLATCRDCRAWRSWQSCHLQSHPSRLLGLYGSGVRSSGKNARQSFSRYHSSCDVEQLARVDLLGACHGRMQNTLP